MGDIRGETTTRARRCGRCGRPFDFGETAYEPGRYSAWTWPVLPVCLDCVEKLEVDAIGRRAKR